MSASLPAVPGMPPLTPERERLAAIVLGGIPLTEHKPHRRIRFAICDPGTIVDRGEQYQEAVANWQMRAVVAVLPELTAEQYPGELDNLRHLLKAVCRLADSRPDDMPLADLVADHYSDSRMVDALLAERGEPRG